MPASAATSGRRALTREHRRQQLIDATIKSIARKGLGSTTLADVAREAGMSQGIVNLHFDSKENLLAETLRYLAEEYDEQFARTLEQARPDPASRLLALMELDLKPAVCDRSKAAVWFAFWGEVKAVPTYQKICAAREQKHEEVVIDIVRDIIRDGGYEGLDAASIAMALGSMTDGMWLSLLINPKSFDRKQALEAVKTYLRAVFPNHYD